jgi:hypothetical protein
VFKHATYDKVLLGWKLLSLLTFHAVLEEGGLTLMIHVEGVAVLNLILLVSLQYFEVL